MEGSAAPSRQNRLRPTPSGVHRQDQPNSRRLRQRRKRTSPTLVRSCGGSAAERESRRIFPEDARQHSLWGQIPARGEARQHAPRAQFRLSVRPGRREGREMPLARTELPRRPIVGLLLLVLAGLTVALKLWSWHLEETYKHVEVVYGQTGLGEQPAQLRVQVDCRGPNLLRSLQREARVDLGLLSAHHYAAVQARDGAESPVLDLRLLVNSHAAFTYGDFRGNTPTGLNNTPREGPGPPAGEWLIHKTFSGRGHEVASIACE